MKKTYTKPEVEYIEFYSEKVMADDWTGGEGSGTFEGEAPTPSSPYDWVD